jgi:hypothetical protein
MSMSWSQEECPKNQHFQRSLQHVAVAIGTGLSGHRIVSLPQDILVEQNGVKTESL